MLDIKKWLKILDYRTLDGFLKSEKGKGGIGEGLMTYTIGYLIYSLPIMLLYALLIMVVGSMVGGMPGMDMGSVMGSFLVVMLIALVVGIIVSLIMFLIVNGTQHLIAGMLGGKGEYGTLVYLDSILMAASFIVLLVVMVVNIVVSLIPLLGSLLSCLILLPILAFWLYQLYIKYKIIMETYAMTSGKALGALILNLLLYLIILVILALLFWAVFIGPMITAMSQMQPTGYSNF